MFKACRFGENCSQNKADPETSLSDEVVAEALDAPAGLFQLVVGGGVGHAEVGAEAEGRAVNSGDALFLEAHPDPMSAKCDAASQMQMDNMEGLLRMAIAVRKAIGSPENVGTFQAPNA